MRIGWPLLIAVHLLVGVLLALILFVTHPFALSDVTMYFQWSGHVVNGEVPYRDFFFDYPPLSLIAMLVPRAMAGFSDLSYGSYVVLLGALMAVVWLASVRVLTSSARRLSVEEPRIKAFVVMATLALPLMLVRFEPWPMLLTALAILAVAVGSPQWSGAWLGLGIATKLYPAVVLPAFAAHWLFRDGRRSASLHAIFAASTAAAILLPFAILSGGGITDTLAFQQGRGLQIETAAAGVIQLLNIGSAERLEIHHVTTYELQGSAVDAYLSIQPLVVIAVIGAAAVTSVIRVRQASGTPTATPTLMAASMGLLIAFLLTNRALSPQHVLWLLPFAWLLTGYRWWLLLGILGLTLLVFPVLYPALLGGDAVAIGFLNLRNALLVVLGIALLVRPVTR